MKTNENSFKKLDQAISTKAKILVKKGNDTITVVPTSYKKGWVTVVDTDANQFSVRIKNIEIKGGRKESLTEHIKRYTPGYQYSTNSTGTRSLICGDDVSVDLEGLDQDQVVAKAKSQMPDYDWDGKLIQWSKLNAGQIRMCIGNVLRANAKRNEKEAKEATK